MHAVDPFLIVVAAVVVVVDAVAAIVILTIGIAVFAAALVAQIL